MAEKILVISPVTLVPHHSGNKKRIRNICSELMRMGYELDLFYAGYEGELDPEHDQFFNGKVLDHQIVTDPQSLLENPIGRLNELLNGLRIRVELLTRKIIDGSDSFKYNKSLFEYRNVRKTELLKNQIIHRNYTAVIVNYAVYSFYLNLIPNHTQKIIDTHDRLTDRYKLFLKNGSKPIDWYSLRAADEKKALEVADTVWAITDDEKVYYESLLNGKSVRVLNLRHLITYRYIPSSAPNKKNVLFIGSDNKLNQDGLYWFISTVWSKVLSNHPDATLIVAGSICKVKETYKDQKNVRFYGKYENDDEVYQLSDICINPMQDGTGLKIKTLEAISHGKQVLSTHVGGSGLTDLVGNGLICTDFADEWVSELSRLFDETDHNLNRLEAIEKAIMNIYDENVSVIRDSLS